MNSVKPVRNSYIMARIEFVKKNHYLSNECEKALLQAYGEHTFNFLVNYYCVKAVKDIHGSKIYI